ncbi:DUF1127 domain-containing protein [Tropicimonas sp. IMCC34043]|uniref:DUF1127 domain-containing protein n=1 Tax=Tropicimonas sp. IMCC34043 TaxID=2248760 RepID=UPI000E25D8F0|nr:DUF1127 domain-containing protein [Tropicimonas sp. IMCC34043]
MTFFETIRSFAAKRAHYARTIRELRSMSNGVARDLGINRDDVANIAYRAVYGA